MTAAVERTRGVVNRNGSANANASGDGADANAMNEKSYGIGCLAENTSSQSIEGEEAGRSSSSGLTCCETSMQALSPGTNGERLLSRLG